VQQQDSTRTASGAKPDSRDGAPAADEHITLSQAAKLAPGRPSSNCVWRWCREGVKAASGTRVRLKHVRFGSRIFTTRQWLNDFGLALAEADAAHFQREENALATSQPMKPKSPSKRARRTASDDARRRHLEAERELEEAGL
jgi:hypothetical protein